MNNIIEVKKLRKEFVYHEKAAGLKESFKSIFVRKKKIKIAVDGISFDISEGEFVGFLGPNGAGKTTTLKMLSGILYPTSGEIKVLNYIPQKRERKFLENIGMVMSQKQQLFWDIPPIDSFLLFKEIYEIPEKEFNGRIEELSTLLDIKDVLKVQVRKLSLGQRMKCELIAALIHKPKVVFLDEPTIGLDVVAKKKMWDFLRKYNKEEKTTIILTSHYMEDIKKLCERVIIIDKGKLLYDGALEKLQNDYIKYKTITLVMNEIVALEKLKEFGKIIEHKETKYVLQVQKEKATQIASKILEKFPVNDILISAPDAEEVIREIFAKGIK